MRNFVSPLSRWTNLVTIIVACVAFTIFRLSGGGAIVAPRNQPIVRPMNPYGQQGVYPNRMNSIPAQGMNPGMGISPANPMNPAVNAARPAQQQAAPEPARRGAESVTTLSDIEKLLNRGR